MWFHQIRSLARRRLAVLLGVIPNYLECMEEYGIVGAGFDFNVECERKALGRVLVGARTAGA